MSRVILRPNQAVDYGTVQTEGSGNVLGDNNWGTRKLYYDDSGSILLYPAFDSSVIPDGKSVIAVRNAHVQLQGGLFGTLHNGWVMSYLRGANGRILKSQAYKQDGFSNTPRVIEGPPIYYNALAPWPVAEISKLTTDVGAATGEFGPKKDKKWCICPESMIILVLDDPVPVPTINYPANNATIATSSVDFKANVALTQEEQPVAAVFQVSRVNTFDDSTVQTFVGGLVQKSGDTSNYDSVVGKDSFTNLGPGKWYIRTKGKDYRKTESAWGATTSFTITHAALPVPVVTNPGSGTVKNTPYGYREASIPTTPAGERFVGVGFQFCQNSDFSTGPVLGWTNNAVGRYTAGPVGYTADPDPTVTPGLNGDKVSSGDPSQYLKQGAWYVRARSVDVYGQVGAWSSPQAFTVSHPPEVRNAWPSGGKAFDDDAYNVEWDFGDAWAGDHQTAYRVRVLDPSANQIYDSGKVTSPFDYAKVNVPGTWLDQNLGLSIQIWDADDVASPVYTSTFKLSTAPFITLNYPAPDEVVITGEPALSWSVSYAPGASQKAYRIVFIRRDNKTVEYDSKTIVGTSTSWTPPTTILKNMSAYQLALTITDTQDLSTQLLRNFSTNYVRPNGISSIALVDNYEDTGYVRVLWSPSTIDPQFVEYRIKRKNLDVVGSEWEDVGSVTDQSVTEYHDWSGLGQYRWRYSVVQVVLLYGAKVEGLPDEFGDVIQVESTHYWLIVPGHSELNTILYNVTGDEFDDKVESNQHTIIGGGGNRVVYGHALGVEGTLNAQIRAASPIATKEIRQRIKQIQFERGFCYLRNPFGDYIKIAIRDISYSRVAGVGTHEMVDISIPYLEVK